MIIETILATLLPAAVESGKQFVMSKLGGVKATTVDEQIKLDNNEIAKLEALAKLDNPGGTPSQWVINLRASARYVAAFGCIAIGSYCLTIPDKVTIGAELIGVAFGFLFGSRIQLLRR